ncbi:MAG TPA: bifunctional DNA-binding transcriptional regulator/O6-methylguanine-DNA methyltransferase Ada, partial [Chloroflexia bacterium]|nr:bifunctional DNA-binding transcriptional regulator/O6-methylguanine-DNA methyltransferase Ada [Chloroflexia bacterium]
VATRDHAADGEFVYGVRSTGIYCRPSCPSRRPGRTQTVFFRVPEAAEQAGFRACRRCRPTGVAARDPQVDAVRRACRAIEAHAGGPLTLEALGAQMGLSPAHAQRTFKRLMGVTPRQYADAVRLRRFKSGVRAGAAVTEALYDAGYGSSSRLYERAPAQLGMTPATYRRGGAGAAISYTLAGCPLGRLLVAATERGVCAVMLGDTDAELEAALQADYPAATITPDGEGLQEWVGALVRHLAGDPAALDLPLDIQGTAFQWRVWEALRAIPAGSTLSYGAIAAALGQPGAARAVGRACATNPVSLLIPCHRAVGSDGSVTGYRWGVARKRALLAQEQRA